MSQPDLGEAHRISERVGGTDLGGEGRNNVQTKPSRESACSVRDLDSIPGSGRSPGKGNGNLLQYSCLENPMDRGTWWPTVLSVAGMDTTDRLTLSLLTAGAVSQATGCFHWNPGLYCCPAHPPHLPTQSPAARGLQRSRWHFEPLKREKHSHFPRWRLLRHVKGFRHVKDWMNNGQ